MAGPREIPEALAALRVVGRERVHEDHAAPATRVLEAHGGARRGRQGVHAGQGVPPRDPEAMGRAILDVLRDAGRRSRFREASLAVAAPHALRHTFDAYEALYAGLVRGGTEGVPTGVLTFAEC